MEAINLDLLPGAMPPIVHASQGDVGRQFKIAIYDDTGAAYSLTGKTLSIVGHKGDGNVFQYAIPSSAISGNEVTITTEEQMTPAAGKALCEIRIEDSGTKLGTCNFIMDVEQGPADMGSLSISALYMIDALFERAQEDINTATAAAATATQKANDAATSATAAATSATAAATSATSAATSATTASSYASTATTEAENASNYANASSLSATTAETYATNAANSATAAANSAIAAAASENKIANMTVSSQSVPYTQSANVVKTEVGGVYNLDFKIPRGEPTSGHDVEANPSGTVTGGDLTKLGIDGTIYNVSGLPDYTQASQNDVLTIGQSGPEWASPAGGKVDKYGINTLRVCKDSSGTLNIYGIFVFVSRYIQNKISGIWNTDFGSNVTITQSYYGNDLSAALGSVIDTWAAPQPTDPAATEARWVLDVANIEFFYDDTTFVGWDDTTNLLKDKTIIPIYKNPFAKEANCLLYNSTTGEAVDLSYFSLLTDSTVNNIRLSLGATNDILPDTGKVQLPNKHTNIELICN